MAFKFKTNQKRRPAHSPLHPGHLRGGLLPQFHSRHGAGIPRRRDCLRILIHKHQTFVSIKIKRQAIPKLSKLMNNPDQKNNKREKMKTNLLTFTFIALVLTACASQKNPTNTSPNQNAVQQNSVLDQPAQRAGVA